MILNQFHFQLPEFYVTFWNKSVFIFVHHVEHIFRNYWSGHKILQCKVYQYIYMRTSVWNLNFKQNYKQAVHSKYITLIDTRYSLSISRSATSFLISSLEVSTLFCTFVIEVQMFTISLWGNFFLHKDLICKKICSFVSILP